MNKRYFGFRVLQTAFMLWLVLTVLFFFFRMLPGDFTNIMLYQGASPEAVEAFKERWGLNDPLYVQYYRYLKNLIQLDAGQSLQYRIPVWQYIKMKVFHSFILIGPAITAAYIIGSMIGVVLGTNRGSLIEKYGIVPIIIFGATPSFVIAIFLILIFSLNLNWFPTSGMVSGYESGASWWSVYLSKDFAIHYVLPFTAVFLRYLYLPTLIMRTNVVEIVDQDFIHYYVLTGIKKLNRLKHIAKHSSLPVITLYPVSMTRALGGLVLVELVFNWPGIGHALIGAVLARDFPVVQFVFFVIAAFVIIANFGIDILYAFIDPRIDIDDGN